MRQVHNSNITINQVLTKEKKRLSRIDDKVVIVPFKKFPTQNLNPQQGLFE